jgi:hypothetical protein
MLELQSQMPQTMLQPKIKIMWKLYVSKIIKELKGKHPILFHMQSKRSNDNKVRQRYLCSWILPLISQLLVN